MYNGRAAEKAETTTCFSICERRSPFMAREIFASRGEEIIEGYPKTITYLNILGILVDLLQNVTRAVSLKNQPYTIVVIYDHVDVRISVSNKLQVHGSLMLACSWLSLISYYLLPCLDMVDINLNWKQSDR